MTSGSLEAGQQPVSSNMRWRDRLLDWKHRLIARPGFQRWAARFPLTRRLSSRRANELFNIAAGFVYSQVLAACVELRLLEILRDGPLAARELARRCELDPEAMLCLLRAAASLELLSDRGGQRFGLGDLGAAMLGNPGVAAMVQHHRHLYADLADPIKVLQREQPTALSRFWPYATASEGDVTPYSDLMSASQSLVANDILDQVPMQGTRHLWDIAGGDGTFIRSALARWPSLKATVLDLEGVAGLAQQRLAEARLAGRARALSGDMFRAPLQGQAPAPSEATTPVTLAADFGPPDLVSLVRVVHDHDDADVMTLFEALYQSMQDGAQLLIAEPMAGTPGAEAMGHAYFGLYLRAMGSGRPRTASEIGAMLAAAGFSHIREINTPRPLLVRIIIAQRQES
ncbi:MAG: methyltransferase [Halieaceae bacterium]|nr:methyltransferase [Halieaceae bacterium]